VVEPSGHIAIPVPCVVPPGHELTGTVPEPVARGSAYVAGPFGVEMVTRWPTAREPLVGAPATFDWQPLSCPVTP